MSAAAVLASEGYEVTVLEKNDKPGGRINYFDADGFRFEMGPSWYWMPEVFENFYNRFGKTASDFYELVRLDPSYRVVFSKDESMDIPADYNALRTLFDTVEPGSAQRLDRFLEHARIKYNVGMNEFVWKPGNSIMEFASLKVLRNAFRLQLFKSISTEIQKVVKNPRLRQLLEFPVLFLGATPEDTPALYSLMNYADIKLGTWYPQGGMYKIAEAFKSIAEEQGVAFEFNTAVDGFEYRKNKIFAVRHNGHSHESDYVVANADYNYVDQHILDSGYRNYDKPYWDSRKMAPSSLLIFLGVSKRVKGLLHHNLFFDADFKAHAHEIYKDASWPSDPLFYVCVPSKTDDSVAPEGMENLFILMPVAPDLDDSDESILEDYYQTILNRIEAYTGERISDAVKFKQFFSVKDFKTTYNSFKGNAYGLANTLMQTAVLKPSIKSKKLSNLYYTGQLTVPGPGLPPSIISGQLAGQLIIKSEN